MSPVFAMIAKGECNGSDKRFSFNIPADSSGILHLFESAIDLLSFATIRKMNGIDWWKDHLLSLAGVYQPREKIEDSAVPLALSQYLQDHMREFEITLTAILQKCFHLKASSKEDALSLAETILEDTDLLSFSDGDVSSMEMSCEEQCGGVCEICSHACEYCGGCTKSNGQMPDISGAEHCPICGGVIFGDAGE